MREKNAIQISAILILDLLFLKITKSKYLHVNKMLFDMKNCIRTYNWYFDLNNIDECQTN